MTTLKELEAAMAIVATANPEDVMRLEMAKNVAGIDFVAEARAQRLGRQPSCDPYHAETAERQQRSLAEQARREERTAEQMAARREELIEHMSAGQTAENRALIRATISNGGG
jgi:hypothetical protein